MTRHNDEVRVDASTGDHLSIEEDLNAAEAIARERAMREGRHGVLITQHDCTSFTVVGSEDVPYGQTRERREWRPVSAAARRAQPACPGLSLASGQHYRPAVLSHTAWAGWSYEITAEEDSLP